MEIEHELRGLKGRLARLQEVFNTLPIQPPGPEEWPFWLEKFNALSGQFSGLERELCASSGILQEYLLEPLTVPTNRLIPTDSIPNILLRSKLAPEVISTVTVTTTGITAEEMKEDRKKIYMAAVRALQDKFSIIQEEFAGAVTEQTSSLLAKEISISSSKSKGQVHEKEDALLETSIRWLYTGQQ